MHPSPVTLSHHMTLLQMAQGDFRTDRLTGVFAVPLTADTAADYAILPGLLTRGCRAYPTMAALCRRLDNLYGATVQGQVYRLGGWQVLTFSVNYLNRRYTLDGNDLTAACTNLLLDMLLDPALEEDAFPADVFTQEKRCLIERLQGEMNEKRLYARQRCEQLLTPNHPYSLNPNGTEEGVAALTPVMAETARRNLLTGARIHWLYQGSGDIPTLTRVLEERFAPLYRQTPAALTTTPITDTDPTTHTEQMSLNQAKLVLGLRSAATEPADVTATQLMITLLGGSATSLLFTHVREEQSLCYYCAATYDRFQGVVLIDSGVQPENAQKTKEEALKQLEAIRHNDFSDQELEAARRSLTQRYLSAGDHPDGLENYYIGQTVYDNYLSPEEKCDRILAVTREQVCEAARQTILQTVYLLSPDRQEVTL